MSSPNQSKEPLGFKILLNSRANNSTHSKNSLKSFPVYIIDGEIYREKHDTRYKGLEFRNNICEECKYSIIGVPYSIFFDKKGLFSFRAKK